MKQAKSLYYSLALLLCVNVLNACRTMESSQSVTSLSSPAGAATVEKAAQIKRFTVWLDELDKSIEGLTAEDAVIKLTDGSARNGVFNLQALGRLYEDEDPAFGKVRKKFKALEDGIGVYAKWEELLEKAVEKDASNEIKAKFKAKKKKAKSELADLLVDEGFIPKKVDKTPYLKSLRSFLESYAWKSPEADRRFVLEALSQQLEDIKAASYDFSHLEDGNGVHEFRRKMRWFSMEAKALNGLVVLKPDVTDCPVPAYSNLVNEEIAKNKYAVLTPNPLQPRPVFLTPCLYVKIAHEIDFVGDLKGAVEEADNSTTEGAPSDAVSVEDQKIVRAILDDLLANDVFGRLQKELAAP